MSFESVEPIVRALLLEGHLLYPYRASNVKNRQRWAFGTLYPKDFCDAAGEGDAHRLHTECVVTGEAPVVRAAVRFMQLERAGDVTAVERRLDTGELALPSLSPPGERRSFALHLEAPDAPNAMEGLHVAVTVSAEALGPAVWKLATSVENASRLRDFTADRAGAELVSLLSTQTVFECRGGAFVSQIDPPAALCRYTETCRSVGTWPVLAGAPGSDDTLLSSPIILPDHAGVSARSPGDLFDATEIDEILSLRILTMTFAEREEARRTDPRARALIERTESLREESILALHGICEVPQSNPKKSAFSPGDHVVLRPAKGGDVLDLALRGEAATVLGVEEDFEGRVYYTVTVDADPGRDLGALGQPGHRFFFSAEELEPAP